MSDNRDTSIPCHLWLGRAGRALWFPLQSLGVRPGEAVPGGWERHGWVLQGGGCSGEGQRWDCSCPGDGTMDGVTVPVVQRHSCQTGA